MADDFTRIHEATGRIILREIRLGREAEGLEAITAMRWSDDAGHKGRDSHVRLALHVERGGEIFIEHEGETRRVKVEPDDRFLHTEGVDDEAADPILRLPTY